jgi:serine protease inhibitor
MHAKNIFEDSRMLLFNGLYFRGDWQQSFTKLEEKRAFNSPKGIQNVKFMAANGLYKYVEIASQNVIAVEIPYKV